MTVVVLLLVALAALTWYLGFSPRARRRRARFDAALLDALRTLGPDGATGYGIYRHLEESLGSRPSFAAIYARLGELERARVVGSRRGRPTPERGGRCPRHFWVRADYPDRDPVPLGRP